MLEFQGNKGPRTCAGLSRRDFLRAGTLGAGFINDDYLFLEEARRQGIVDAIVHPGGLGNYFRPLSREAWFAVLSPLAGGEPVVFHLAQLALFAAALVLLADLLSALAPGEARDRERAEPGRRKWVGSKGGHRASRRADSGQVAPEPVKDPP